MKSQWKDIGVYCGNRVPPRLMSPENQLTITYTHRSQAAKPLASSMLAAGVGMISAPVVTTVASAAVVSEFKAEYNFVTG